MENELTDYSRKAKLVEAIIDSIKEGFCFRLKESSEFFPPGSKTIIWRHMSRLFTATQDDGLDFPKGIVLSREEAKKLLMTIDKEKLEKGERFFVMRYLKKTSGSTPPPLDKGGG